MSETINTPESAADALMADSVLSDEILSLNINNYVINIRSNAKALLDWCRYYFTHVVCDTVSNPNLEILAIERPPVELNVEYKNWVRADKKKTLKDAIYDLPGARILKKVRTGMVFLQSQTHLIAAGECLKNTNQVINFINAQYMSWVQNHQAVICHAAGIIYKDHALGMAGFSGGGKSTLMLDMLNKPGSRFLSNDRLLLKKTETETMAIGIPKLPRVNPGTIIHNSNLHNLLSAKRREELLQLPKQELWDLEEKYDVIIDESYGSDRIQYQAPIKNFLLLNWRHDSNEAVQIKQVDLSQRSDLLAALMKSPGPFYQYNNGDLFQQLTPLDEQVYIDAFENIDVYEASGKVDFQTLNQLCYQQLLP